MLIRVTFTDADNLPMPATGVTIQAKRPDGTVVDGTVTAGSGSNVFEARFTADAAGIWKTKAVCAGPAVATDGRRFKVLTLDFDDTD